MPDLTVSRAEFAARELWAASQAVRELGDLIGEHNAIAVGDVNDIGAEGAHLHIFDCTADQLVAAVRSDPSGALVSIEREGSEYTHSRDVFLQGVAERTMPLERVTRVKLESGQLTITFHRPDRSAT